MPRDHRIKGMLYLNCWMCEKTIRKPRAIYKDGMYFCDDCYSKGEYAHPAWIGYPLSRIKDSDYGVCTWIEECGFGDNTGEYGVLTMLTRTPTSSISGEYGTLVHLPDFKMEA